MRSNPVLLTPLFLLVLGTGTAGANTFKCTTADGTVQYTAVPPPGADCHELKLRAAPAARPPTTETTPRNGSASPTSGSTVNGTPTEEAVRITRQNCENAKTRLATLTSNSRIRIKDGNQYRVISEEERQDKIKLAKQQVDVYCKGE